MACVELMSGRSSSPVSDAAFGPPCLEASVTCEQGSGGSGLGVVVPALLGC